MPSFVEIVAMDLKKKSKIWKVNDTKGLIDVEASNNTLHKKWLETKDEETQIFKNISC